MKSLFLIRHAKSSWNFPELSDFERPLNKRGKENIPEMGRRLKADGVKVQQIVSSPANRALTTARGIAAEIGYDSDKIAEDSRLYHASSGIILSIIQETNDECDSLMLFGHNPGFTYLIEDLTNEFFDNLVTCGVYGIRFDVNSWKMIKNGSGTRFYYDYPKSGRLI